MAEFDVYKEIAERTDGSIYIGVVGPVRTGKSTFVRRFMDLMVVSTLKDEWYKERLVDELPQSGAGKTIMTTQISFVPGEPVDVDLSPVTKCSIRLVDCVGFMVEGAFGDTEDGQPRMVSTPWNSEDVPFRVAAEEGTRKVIRDHSTIGLVITTDGSITDIPRENYIQAEAQAVAELKALGKPFVMVLNSRNPAGEKARAVQEELQKKFEVPVMAMDVMHMDVADIQDLMETVLYEFPVRQVNFTLPEWVTALPQDHWLMASALDFIRDRGELLNKIRDYGVFDQEVDGNSNIESVQISDIQPGSGTMNVDIAMPRQLYFEILSSECGMEIANDGELINLVRELAGAKRKYDRLLGAWATVQSSGYGLIFPELEDMSLETPEIVRQGSHFGVRLKASAPSWHIIRVDLNTEVSPILGTVKQVVAQLQSSAA